MINAVDGLLIKRSKQGPVQGLGGGQIMAEGFFEDDARAIRAARLGQLLHNGGEDGRRDSHVEGGAQRAVELLPQRLERRRIGIVTAHIAEQGAQSGARIGIEFPALFKAGAGAGLEVIKVFG